MKLSEFCPWCANDQQEGEVVSVTTNEMDDGRTMVNVKYRMTQVFESGSVIPGGTIWVVEEERQWV